MGGNIEIISPILAANIPNYKFPCSSPLSCAAREDKPPLARINGILIARYKTSYLMRIRYINVFSRIFQKVFIHNYFIVKIYIIFYFENKQSQSYMKRGIRTSRRVGEGGGD